MKVQKRGKGSKAYSAPSYNFETRLRYPDLQLTRNEKIRAVVTDIVHDRARSSVLARVKYETGKQDYVLASEGLSVGSLLELGTGSKISIGNTLPLNEIPEGMPVFNVEKVPGDGGTIAKAGGSYALLIGKSEGKVFLKTPSKRKITVLPECRATLGLAANGGRIDKPMLKAGNAFHKSKKKNSLWPKNRGVKMNAVSHKHGGSGHHVGKSTTKGQNARPGQKVGHIKAKRTGRKKK